VGLICVLNVAHAGLTSGFAGHAKKQWAIGGFKENMKECERCHTTENITKHHLHRPNDGTILFLCQSCHDKEHEIIRKENSESAELRISVFERRIRRAKRRIKRDTKIIQETEKKLLGVVE